MCKVTLNMPQLQTLHIQSHSDLWSSRWWLKEVMIEVIWIIAMIRHLQRPTVFDISNSILCIAQRTGWLHPQDNSRTVPDPTVFTGFLSRWINAPLSLVSAMWNQRQWHQEVGGRRFPHHRGCGLRTQEGAAQHQGHQWGQGRQDSSKRQRPPSSLTGLSWCSVKQLTLADKMMFASIPHRETSSDWISSYSSHFYSFTIMSIDCFRVFVIIKSLSLSYFLVSVTKWTKWVFQCWRVFMYQLARAMIQMHVSLHEVYYI